MDEETIARIVRAEISRSVPVVKRRGFGKLMATAAIALTLGLGGCAVGRAYDSGQIGFGYSDGVPVAVSSGAPLIVPKAPAQLPFATPGQPPIVIAPNPGNMQPAGQPAAAEEPVIVATAVIAVPTAPAVVVPAPDKPLQYSEGSNLQPTVAPTVATTAVMVAGKDFEYSPDGTAVRVKRDGKTIEFRQTRPMTMAEMSSAADYLRTGMIKGVEVAP